MGKTRNRNGAKVYTFAERLRAIQLIEEEGYNKGMVSEELGIPKSTISGWLYRYRREGEEGLTGKRRARGKAQVSAEAKKKAEALKREHPEYGTRRISQILRRVFFLKASPETVRRSSA